MLREQPTLSWSAEEDYDRLARRLDVPGPSASRSRLPRWMPPHFTAGKARRPLRLGGAAAVATALAVVIWLGVSNLSDDDRADFMTLTQENGPPGIFVDIVLAPGLSEADMRALLQDIGGTIVVGPSAVGRYTVRLNRRGDATGDRNALIASLQADPRVRFAGWNFTLDGQEESP
jgi:hypothetical protein